jgi:hypothetical protein
LVFSYFIPIGLLLISFEAEKRATKEVCYANLNEMPAVDIAKYLGKRILHLLKRFVGR